MSEKSLISTLVDWLGELDTGLKDELDEKLINYLREKLDGAGEYVDCDVVQLIIDRYKEQKKRAAPYCLKCKEQMVNPSLNSYEAIEVIIPPDDVITTERFRCMLCSIEELSGTERCRFKIDNLVMEASNVFVYARFIEEGVVKYIKL